MESCQSLALTQVRRRKLHDLTSIVPLKMKQFLGIELKILSQPQTLQTDMNAQAKGRDIAHDDNC